MKNFFGSIFINRDKLAEAGINYPIKVEYYKITNEEDKIKQNKLIYGIQIIKTAYFDVCKKDDCFKLYEINEKEASLTKQKVLEVIGNDKAYFKFSLNTSENLNEFLGALKN